MFILFTLSICITLLFFLSGFHKISGFMDVVKGFVSKTSIPLQLSKLIIVGVILLEIIAPLIIALYAYDYPNSTMNKNLPKLSIVALIVFTILATLIYHFPPYGNNYYSFMSNVSTIGGLSALYLLL